MEGWISLHRKIRKNPIFNDMELLRLWLICLTEATHKERDQPIGRQMVHLEAGQFVTGRFDLQTMYNAGLKPEQQKSPATVWRWLEFLKSSEFVSINSSNKFSIVSIVNWDKYQKGEQEIDQQVSNKRATDEQQVSTNNNVNNANNDNNLNKKESIPYSEIVAYLNLMTDSSYKSNSKTTQRHIKARWSEGHRLSEFKTVIDKKTAEWKTDAKMNQYLRPETLFGNRFESYLNQKIVLKGGQADVRNENVAYSGNALPDTEREYFDQFVRR